MSDNFSDLSWLDEVSWSSISIDPSSPQISSQDLRSLQDISWSPIPFDPPSPQISSQDLRSLQDISWSPILEDQNTPSFHPTSQDLRSLQNIDWDDSFENVQHGGNFDVPSRREFLRNRRRVQSTSSKPLIFNFTKLEEIYKQNSTFHRTSLLRRYRVQHNMGDVLDLYTIEKDIDTNFSKILGEGTKGASENDIISIKITHQELTSAIFINARKSVIKPQEFLNQVYLITQSNTMFLLDGFLDVEISITSAIQGSGKKCKALPVSVSSQRHQKRGFISISNEDNSCGYLAIALGKYHHEYDHETDHKWRSMRMNAGGRLTRLASDLCSAAGVNMDTPLGIDDLEVFQRYLNPRYQLIVVNGETLTCDFKGPEASKHIILQLQNHHYDLITKIHTYMNRRQFCVKCWIGYDKPNQHNCKNCCDLCHSSTACSGDMISCTTCNKKYKGSSCLENHILNKLCSKSKRCRTCEVEYPVQKKHRCGQYLCTKCGLSYFETPHYCSIKPLKHRFLQEEDNLKKVFVSFDIESESNGSGSQKTHQPILLISYTSCDICLNGTEKVLDDCAICGNGKSIFYGPDCVEKFGDYLYKNLARSAHAKNANIFVFAHNFKRYDGHFVIRDIFDRDFVDIKPILKGSSILKIDVGNIRFMDSLSFFQLKLAALLKSFGFESLVLKGYFPHEFNTSDNRNYVGDIPDIKYFGFESLKESEKQGLVAWHSSFEGSYNLKEEMIKYCENDVVILIQAVLRFRKLFKDVTDIDPFTRNFTLASVGLETYRAKFLGGDTLGITPNGSYNIRNSSMIGNVWMDWIEKEQQKIIKREFRIGNYWADGCDTALKIVYEFWGCRYHGCQRCYPNRDDILLDNLTAAQLFRRTQEKVQIYQRLGYNIVDIWECDFRQQSSLNEQLHAYYRDRMGHYQSIKATGNIHIRDSFFGGRTNNLRFWYEAQDNEAIEYKDVTSEYPFVLKNFRYPMGHPKLINKDFDTSLRSYFGFVKCKMLAPSSLYLPVLPSRVNGKLEFVLCRTCAETSNQSSCHHCEEERYLLGTWATPEIQKALDTGYRVIKIYEVLHYEQSSEDLFKDYINMWLKIKQEASGFPRGCETIEQKTKYIEEYAAREGIQLDMGNIEKNPGKRFIAKLMLNSFWGKLAQRSNMGQTSICKSYEQYWKVASDDNIRVTGEFMPNDKTIIVAHELMDSESADEGNTSVAVSSFVTTYARLHLYKFLEKVLDIGLDRLLYFDTDSLIFVRRNSDPEISTGNFLGDLTDEIRDSYGNAARCIRFVSGGPKNYAYQVVSYGKTYVTVKTKGITTDAKCLQVLTIDRMMEMTQKYVTKTPDYILVNQWRIASNKWDHRVVSDTFKKIYRVVSEKRRVSGNGTLPFGYVGDIMY